MRYLLLLFCTLITISLTAKDIFKISGVVQDMNSSPVEGATVRAFSLDSLFLEGVMTNAKGRFQLKVSQKTSIIEISCLGYKKFYKSISIENYHNVFSLDTIILQDESINLNEITITGKVSAIQMRGDTLEYNTSIYALPEQASVRDLLKNLPNVIVNDKGQIFVQGKEVNRILVDGKEFFSVDPNIASKSLPALIVDKVQVIEQSSETSHLTGFDNGEKETVLNLTVKEENKIGLMIQSAAGVGRDFNGNKTRYDQNGYINILKGQDIYNFSLENNNTNNGAGGSQSGENSMNRIGVTINKSFNKYMNISSSLMYGLMNIFENIDSEMQTILSPDSYLFENSKNLSKNKSKTLNFDAKAEWNPTDKNTLVIHTRINYMHNNDRTYDLFSSLNAIRDTLYSGNSSNNSKGNNYSLGISVDYVHRLRKKGRVLSTSLQSTIDNADSRQTYEWNRKFYENQSFVRDSLVSQWAINTNLRKYFNITLSYVEPISDNQFMQFAYTTRFNTNFANKSTYDNNDNYLLDAFVLLSAQSPCTEQSSLNQRYTLNYRNAGKKTDLIMGVNVDIDDSNNETFLLGDTIKSSIKQKVANYSPILNMKHRFNKSNVLSFDYVGIMTSPTPLQLQDYTDITNPTNSIKGNPELKPQFLNSSSLSFTGSNSSTQGYYSASLSGRFIANAIQSAVTINPETGSRVTTYKNINGNWNINFRSSYYMPIKGTNISIGNTLISSYDVKKGFINNIESSTKSFILDEQPHIRYYDSDSDFECTFRGLFRCMGISGQNSVSGNMKTQDWATSVSITYLLPFKIRCYSSFSWSLKKGYGNFRNMNENILDITLTRECFSKKYGIGSIQLSGFDLLQSRKQLSRNVGSNYVQNTVTATMGGYFMCSFIYTFNIFPTE